MTSTDPDESARIAVFHSGGLVLSFCRCSLTLCFSKGFNFSLLVFNKPFALKVTCLKLGGLPPALGPL